MHGTRASIPLFEFDTGFKHFAIGRGATCVVFARRLMLECLHVVNFWNGIDRRVFKGSVKQGLFVVNPVSLFTVAPDFLLEPFLFFEMPSKYELPQFLLFSFKVLWEARGTNAFFSLNYFHDPGKRPGMHK